MLKKLALSLILTSFSTPSMAVVSSEAKVDQERIHLNQVELLLRMFKLHNRDYPRDDEGLRALVQKPDARPDWRGPYTDGNALIDTWGNPLVYRAEGRKAQLRSAGPDGVFNSSDDLVHTI